MDHLLRLNHISLGGNGQGGFIISRESVAYQRDPCKRDWRFINNINLLILTINL